MKSSNLGLNTTIAALQCYCPASTAAAAATPVCHSKQCSSKVCMSIKCLIKSGTKTYLLLQRC